MQRTRHMLFCMMDMLFYMMDMLFDIFEKEPNFRHFHTSRRILGAPVRFNGGFAAFPAVTSPVKRQKAEFALPGRSRARWRRVSRVSLEEAEQEKLAVGKDGWARIAITRKRIVTLKFRQVPHDREEEVFSTTEYTEHTENLLFPCVPWFSGSPQSSCSWFARNGIRTWNKGLCCVAFCICLIASEYEFSLASASQIA